MSHQHQQEEEEELGRQAMRLANCGVLPMILKSALELNVIDILWAAGDGVSLSPSDIAAQLPTKNSNAPVALDRMLRLLASHSVLKCSARTGPDGQVERLYGAAPICKYFVKDPNGETGSVGPLFLLRHEGASRESWFHFNDAILEGGIPFNMANNGMTAFEYSKTDERYNRAFNRAMSNQTTLIMKKILDVYKGFEEINVLVDVGGGIGVNLKLITTKYSNIKGINFDLPHVIADAPSYPGVKHVGGDMFKSVPEGGDVIFMKSILHNWTDELCLTLLKNCCKSLPSTGKVICVESVLPEVPDSSAISNIVCALDLQMFTVSPGGKERTKKEFEALALKSGFSRLEVVCSAYQSRVMEFHK